MSMSKTTNTYNRQNWEDADFPLLCQTCLGDNPYIRMTKEKYGKECKICTRPFTVFRWCPGACMRFKKTEVCQTCAKIKNVCQTCLLDLEYGLPTQVRDRALSILEDLPKNDANREYYIQNIENELATTSDGASAPGALGKAKTPSEVLLRLARTTPYYKRNRPHICSFWVKGECKRGEECPYRHERPTDPEDPLSDQNIRDRYYGVNDPVADKLMKRAAGMPRLEPPDDRSITTLYVGNLGERLGESELRNHFYQYGEIRNINVVTKQQYAFIQFMTRSSAELAAERTFNKLILQGRRLNIKWGKSQGRQGFDDDEERESYRSLEPVPGLPSLPLPPEELRNNYFNLSGTAAAIPLPPGQAPPQGMEAVHQMMHHPPPSHVAQRPPLPAGSVDVPPGIPSTSVISNSTTNQVPPFYPSHVRGQVRPAFFPQPPPIPGIDFRPPPPLNHGAIHYPSQDPTQMGATPDKKQP